MPNDLSVPQQPPRSQDWGLNRATGWTLKICWRTNTCFLTGKQLWRNVHITAKGRSPVQVNL
jgi:hypothetical protein